MSKLKVDQISKATGAAPAIFTLPATDGTAGQYLKTDGSGALSWGTPPDESGGVTHLSTWRLTANLTNTAATISSDLEAVDAPDGFASLGDPMIVSSGIFEFPNTGIWHIHGHFYYWQNGNGGSYYGTGHLWTTINNSTYVEAAQCRTSDYYSSYGSMTVDYLFDVTDKAQRKCKFAITQGNSAGQLIGDTNINKTYFTFTRLADT
jgi:hypothetical protein